MKVLFLNPPVDKKSLGREGRCTATFPIKMHMFPPLSLMYPAALLEKEGFDCQIFDGVVENDFNIERVCNSFDLIVMNVSIANLDEDLKLVKKIKKRFPETRLAAIGIISTVKPDLLIKEGFDFVLRNEIEYTLLELCDSLKSGKELDEVKGLTFLDNEKIVTNEFRGFEVNLNEIPFPARHLINVNKYVFPFNNKPYTTVLTNRGCPFPCIFCTAHIVTGKKFRMREVNNVIKEIKEIVYKYKIKFISFYADTFTLNKKFVLDLCKEIRRNNLKFNWACNSRVDTVDEEMIKEMKRSGCKYIFYGAESGSQEILDNSKKGIIIEQIKKAVKIAKKYGLEVITYFIFGLPGETKETAKKTLDLALELDPDYCYFAMATPYPGTEFYEIAKRENLIIDDNSSKNQLDVTIKTKELLSEELKEILNNAYKKFYFRPKKIVKEVFKLIRKRQWYEIIKGAQMFNWMIKTKL